MTDNTVYHDVKFIDCGYYTEERMPLKQIWKCRIRHTVQTLEGEKQKEHIIDVHTIETGEAGYTKLAHNTFEKAFRLKDNIKCTLSRTEEGEPIYRLICDEEK